MDELRGFGARDYFASHDPRHHHARRMALRHESRKTFRMSYGGGAIEVRYFSDNPFYGDKNVAAPTDGDNSSGWRHSCRHSTKTKGNEMSKKLMGFASRKVRNVWSLVEE